MAWGTGEYSACGLFRKHSVSAAQWTIYVADYKSETEQGIGVHPFPWIKPEPHAHGCFATLTLVSLLYLIRHGQAGPRDRYDCLSSLGRRQARLLGAWLAREGVRFDSVWTGALARQTQTAELVLGALAEAGSPHPEPLLDTRWNEFDLDAVYAAIAPQMAAADPAFRRHYESLLTALSSGQGEIHRHWTPADTSVVRAWIHEQYRFTGESWAAFVERIRAAGEAPLAAAGAGQRAAVFTSATPVGITLGRVFPLEPSHVMQLAGAALNTNMTILDVADGRPSLAAFNSTPHLDQAEWRTFR